MLEQLSKLRCIGYFFTLTLLCGNPLWADDTEIFFSRASDETVQPNVLFVLDGSGSMDKYDCTNGTSSYSPCGDGSVNGSTTRLARLKDSLKEVLNNTSNVNVGLMRFSSSNSGGRVIYPVRPIDQQFCNGEPCGDDTIFTEQVRTGDSTDDAVELYSGEVYTNESSLALMNRESDVANAWVGLRFPDLQIPQGATITDARLIFTSVNEEDSTAQITVHAQDNIDTPIYSEKKFDISKRTRTYNSVSWNGIEKWEEGGVYESPDISSLVQLVVNKPGWCGGNALGLTVKGSGDRFVHTFDGGSSKGPAIKVSYKLSNIPETGGCTKSSIISRISTNADDATEETRSKKRIGRGNRWSWANIVSDPSNKKLKAFNSAIRFKDIQIPKNTRILNASLTLTTRTLHWHPLSFRPGIDIHAEDTAYPSNLNGNRYNISNRSLTASVNWSDTDINTNDSATSTSPPITGLVQELVNKGDWNKGNPIVFVLKPAGTGGYTFYSADANKSKAPLLKIEYETRIRTAADKVSGPVTDVRSEIIEEMEAMVASGGTPTVGALLEAQRYFAGDAVDYGKTRVHEYADWPNYWGTYSRVSTPGSYTGGTVVRHSDCQENALDSRYCSTEHITGDPIYISPFTHECQSNHIVLLTDGYPTPDSTAANKVLSITGGTCEEKSGGNGTCGAEIAKHMFENDQHDFAGDQFITTHTIGFNFSTDWLRDVASDGGGSFYTADSAGQLSTALANIINSVQEEATTFVAPGATVDHFSKISHRSDIYLALFQPKASPQWVGNLKRYDFSGKPAVLTDANNEAAIDPETGEFKEGAQSIWSASPDGNSVPSGGAASRLTPSTRNIYTYTGTSKYLPHTSNEFDSDNDKITTDHLGLASDASSEKENLLDWARGYDIDDEDADSLTSDSRHFVGDPLHSKPVIVTYGGTSANPDSLILFGTNEGFIHAIDTSTGDEEFAFIPTELLPNLKPQYDNTPGSDKIYGIDGALSVWKNDKNNDGAVEDDDHVYLYAGMRRGGTSYYALNITDKDAPEYLWQIDGGPSGTTGFYELAETWSQMIPATIKYGSTVKKVLIFGGGYDNAQDDKETRSEDQVGRALYIVDATDGSLIWSAGAGDGNETETYEDMVYSMPATPKVIDIDGDGAIEQIYIGDMGGRLWRFDIDTKANDLEIDGGIIADLGQDGTLSDARRFYHTPDISLSRLNGKLMLNIAVGTGYQAHPLNTAIEDRFYLIRYPYEYAGEGKYGLAETIVETSNTTDENPTPEITTTTTYRPIKESDLYDTTNNLISEGTADQISAARQGLANAEGWYIKMERNGEKILGSSVTFDNVVMFASYIPDGTTTGCAPQIGSGVFWAVNLWDGTPAEEFDGDETKLSKADRNKPIPGSGLPPPPQTLILQTKDETTNEPIPGDIQIVTVSGGNTLLTHDDRSLIERVYWSEYPNF